MPYQMVVMGASSGGSRAINGILRKLPQNFPVPIAIAIVLHMAENTSSLRQMYHAAHGISGFRYASSRLLLIFPIA